MNEVYLDNAATTQLDPQVIDALITAYQRPSGNASSIHRMGVASATRIELARDQIARRIQARTDEIVFTSCGTESNHLALIGACLSHRHQGDHLIVSRIEHASVLAAADWLQTQGFRVSHLDADCDGRIDIRQLSREISDQTILVSVMHANNEVGTIQDIASIGAICASRGILFHTDACQSFTKVDIDVKAQNVDLMSLSAHKIHGPRGVAALFVRKGLLLEPLLRGGGQESGLRSGTYNTEGIIAFGVAAEVTTSAHITAMTELCDLLISRVTAEIPGAILNGPRENRLCSNANFTFAGVQAKQLFFRLDRAGFVVSIGSACASGKKTPSHVLLAMGRDPQSASESLRVSLSKWTSCENIAAFVDALSLAVAEERSSDASPTL